MHVLMAEQLHFEEGFYDLCRFPHQGGSDSKTLPAYESRSPCSAERADTEAVAISSGG